MKPVPAPPRPADDSDEARLLELYRRMRQGQKDMFRELAEVMVHREQDTTVKQRSGLKGED